MFVFSESESAQKVGVRNKESELGSRTPKTKGECEKQGKVWQLDKESFQDNKKKTEATNVNVMTKWNIAYLLRFSFWPIHVMPRCHNMKKERKSKGTERKKNELK